MKSTLTPLILAFLLLAAGSVCWTLGQAQDRIARASTEVATMEFGAVEPLSPGNPDNDNGMNADGLEGSLGYAARVPVIGTDITRDAKDARTTAAYWLGRYDALALERDAGGAPVERDPQALLLAANAGYRASRLDTADRQTALQRLESIIRNYGDVLKSGAQNNVLGDAAYNYEFAVRRRDALERARANAPPAADDREPPPAIHGRPGGPPKDTDAKKFKIVVPKRSDERNTDPEGGQGQDRVRKG
jgi:hypothetical protein